MMGTVMEGHTWTGSLRLEIRPVREAKTMFKLHYGVWGEGTANIVQHPPIKHTRSDVLIWIVLFKFVCKLYKQETLICQSGWICSI